jgi:hypothetical protein
MNRLPKEIYDQLKVKQRQTIAKTVKPIVDKGQIVIRIPTAFNPEINITDKDVVEIVLIDKEPKELSLKIRREKG